MNGEPEFAPLNTSLQPIYGRKGKIVMFVNLDSSDMGAQHLAHLCRRFYDWSHDDIPGTVYRREGFFADHASYISTLRWWNRKMPKFAFGTNFSIKPTLYVDEFDSKTTTGDSA